MKSGAKCFLLFIAPTTQICFHRILTIVLHLHIIFVLFSYCSLWRLFSKMHWASLKGNALKVPTEISSSQCYAVKLKLVNPDKCDSNLNRGAYKHIYPKLLFLCCQFNMLQKSLSSLSIIKLVFSMKYFCLEQQAHF